MTAPVSARSKVRHFEIAALFSAAVAKRAQDVELVSFATRSELVRFRSSQSILRTMEKVESRIGKVGHSTNLGRAVTRWLDAHDRVIVFLDMQTHDQMPSLDGVQVYVFNTSGYRATPFAVGRKGHYEIGGFNDATFRLMGILENLRDADWPF